MSDLTIYQEKILVLAHENKKSIAIEDFNYSFDMKNPMCGDEVKVRINIIDNKIENISAIVRGCALCEASAGLVVRTFNQNALPKNNFIENFKKWLSDNGYKATNGTISFPESGLTDYHTKEGVYYSTIKLCIEYNDR